MVLVRVDVRPLQPVNVLRTAHICMRHVLDIPWISERIYARSSPPPGVYTPRLIIAYGPIGL